ncbi:MAG: amidase [Proteobacteria bacterium]|nr:amidase [Pseudomonadota bacterium]
MQELIHGYRRRDFSPVDVMRAVSARIATLNPALNAFTTLCLEDAEDKARDAERAIMNGDDRPLLGVPIAVKDMIDTAGVRTTYGSAMYVDHLPASDAEVVRQLLKAGAILVGKTATHEFAWGFTTANPHFGPTRNPWDLNRIPGGSSGGSAAAVVADLVPVAIGTDTGGSIRLPAAYCGVAGFKPTYGRVDATGVFPLAPSLDHVGPIARDPEDLRTIMSVIEARRPRFVRCNLPTHNAKVLAGMRIGISHALHRPTPSAGYEEIFRSICGTLSAAGAELVDLTGFDLPDASPIFSTTLLAEALHVHRRAGLYPSRIGDYGKDVLARITRACNITLDDYQDAVADRLAYRAAVSRLFGEVDLLISLCASEGPTSIPKCAEGEHAEPNDPRSSVLGYTAPQNLAGLPSCALRAGFDTTGLPVGIQITGPQNCDHKVLSLASTIHQLTSDVQRRRPSISKMKQP